MEKQTLPPSNNMVWAILTTLLCCLPFGIVAIVKASKVNSLWIIGQHDEAIRQAESAKKWSLIAAGCGLLYIIFYVIYLFVIGAGIADLH